MMIAFQNCAKQGSIPSSNQNATDTTTMLKTMDTLRTQISSLSADDLSCVADADCAMVGVGAGHCGLPTFQVLGSMKSSAFDDVLVLARQFRDVEKNYTAANPGLYQSCGAPAYAPPTCVQNSCVINYPGRN